MSRLFAFNQQPTDRGTSIINDISHLVSLPVAACNERIHYVITVCACFY